MLSQSAETQDAIPWRPSSWILHGLAVSASAALLAYLLHHLPPLAGHAILSVSAATALTTVLTVWVAGRSALRPAAAAPVLVLSPDAELQVKETRLGDVDFCAELHAEALPHGFFVALGPRFLRAYHRGFAESPNAQSHVATLQGHPIGFVAGAVDPAEHRRWLLRHRGLGLALLGTGALLVRPRVGLRFLRTRVQRYASVWRRTRGSGSGIKPQLSSAHLAHVATVKGARGVGAGAALVEAFVAGARSKGVGTVTLTTLEGAGGAGGFYERQGWSRSVCGLVFDGRRYEQWRLDRVGPR